LYGTLFGNESEAAFSNYRLWESVGFVVAFAYSFYLCTAVKLYILTSVLVVAMIGYLAAELLHRRIAQLADGGRGAVVTTTVAITTCSSGHDKSVVCR